MGKEKDNRGLRNSNIEVLRIVALFGILLWHVSMHGFDYANIEKHAVENAWCHSLCAAIFAPCVNLFVLISGYYGIRLKRQSLINLESQAIFYSYLKIISVCIIAGDIVLSKYIVNFVPVIGRVWWFLTAYVLLMLASPIINEGAKKLSNRHLFYLIIGWLMINGVGMLLRLEINGSNFQSFFLIYIIGIYIKRISEKLKAFNCKYMLIG